MPKKLDIYDSTGAVVSAYELQDSCLESEKGTQAVHDVVIAYMAEQRAGTASTKTRGEVSGSGAKPWRQKGTGRARVGSVRNPVWRHGGIIFGPKPRSFAKKVNKKVRMLALKRAFPDRVNDDAVMVLNAFDIAEPKTKQAVAVFQNLKVDMDRAAALVVKDYDEKIERAVGNLPNVVLIKAATLNVYQLLLFQKLVVTKDAMDEFVQRLA